MGRRLRTYGVVGNVVCKLCSLDWFTCGYFTLAGASGCVCVGVLGEGAKLGFCGEEVRVGDKSGNSGSRQAPELGSTTGKGKAGCSSCPRWGSETGRQVGS